VSLSPGHELQHLSITSYLKNTSIVKSDHSLLHYLLFDKILVSLRYSQFVWTIDRLGQPVTALQVIEHFVGIHLIVGLLTQRQKFPESNPEHPKIGGWCELLVLKGFHSEPFDGSVLIVSQTVVVVWEDVS
jgi:hypothetical protein